MSTMIWLRSANEGFAPACRLPFSAVEGDKRCDLSLKDMSLSQRVSELIDCGVTSFKIEGRMKRPEYVAAAVKVYRNAIDHGEVGISDEENLRTVFFRSGYGNYLMARFLRKCSA